MNEFIVQKISAGRRPADVEDDGEVEGVVEAEEGFARRKGEARRMNEFIVKK